MHDSGSHGSVAESGIVVGVEHSDGRLIQNRHSRLIHDGCLGVIQNRDRGLADIGFLGAAVRVASEIVAIHQQRLEHRIIGIDAGINDGHDGAGPGGVVNRMSGVAANQLHGGLSDVAFPDGAAVITHRGAVAKIRRRRSGR